MWRSVLDFLVLWLMLDSYFARREGDWLCLGRCGVLFERVNLFFQSYYFNVLLIEKFAKVLAFLFG